MMEKTTRRRTHVGTTVGGAVTFEATVEITGGTLEEQISEQKALFDAMVREWPVPVKEAKVK